MASPAELAAGASSAAASPTPSNPATVTRADLVGPARRNSLLNVEAPAGRVSNLKFPTNLGPHYMNIGISKSDRRTTIYSLPGASGLRQNVNSITDTETYVTLPLPENIKDVTQIQYSESAVVGGANALQAVGGAAAAGLGSFVNSQSTIGGIVGAVSQALSAPIYNEVIARTGITPNQMLTVLLQGPRYKEHTFSWKLYPRNRSESEVIRDIITKLKISSRPGTDANRQYFTFPRLFNLSFTINGSQLTEEISIKNYLFAFKPAVLTGISVNYTPSGQPSLYKDVGAPDGVELTLNFKEVEYWLNENGVEPDPVQYNPNGPTDSGGVVVTPDSPPIS